jgi:3-oxoacyl-[acyl-carrier-protein] synthase II
VKPQDHRYGFDPGKRVDHKVQRQVDPFIVYGIDAAGPGAGGCRPTDMDEDEGSRRRLDRSGIGGLRGSRAKSLVWPERGRGGSARTSSTGG